MKQINPEIKAVICSGYSANTSASEILSEEVRAILQKPFEKKDLLNLVANINGDVALK